MGVGAAVTVAEFESAEVDSSISTRASLLVSEVGNEKILCRLSLDSRVRARAREFDLVRIDERTSIARGVVVGIGVDGGKGVLSSLIGFEAKDDDAPGVDREREWPFLS